MTVLIAGVAGFLGSHLADRLLRDGETVIGVDNLSTGSIDNISHLFGNSDFSFIEADVNSLKCPSHDIDMIVHMASPASPKYFTAMQLEIALANSQGTHNLLSMAKELSASFLLTSTSECYGDPEVHPQSESYLGNVDPIGIRGVYDESKRFAEMLTMTFYRLYNLDTRIVRIFNTYGPRMRPDDGRVVPSFFRQALGNSNLSINGDGNQTRSFCYVSDMIEGIARLMRHPESPEIHLPINLGNPQEITILELAKMIKRLTASQSKIGFNLLPEGDPARRCPDIQKAEGLLNWHPKVNLDFGLLETAKCFEVLIKPFNEG